MNFWHLVRVIKAKKWVIVGIVAITLLVIAIAAPKPRVIYEATALVKPSEQVMQGGVSTAGNTENRGNQPDRSIILSNLVTLAQNPEVFARAIDLLEKTEDEQRQANAELGKVFEQRPVRQLSRIEVKPGEVLTYANFRSDVADIGPVYNASIGEKGTTTDIIRITVKMTNGDVAPYLANAVAQAFADVFREKSQSDTREYIRFLETSRAEAKAKLDELRQSMADYKKGSGVVQVDSETQAALSSISSLENARSAAQSAVNEQMAALRDIDAQLAKQPAVIAQPLPAEMNPRVVKLQEELAQAEADLRMLAQRYRPTHDAYKAAQARIDTLKDQIAREGKTYSPPSLNEIHQDLLKKRSDAEYALATAQARLSVAEASLAEARAKVVNLTQAEPRLAQLMTEYTQAENNYKTLSDRHSQALIAEKEYTRTGSIVPYGWAYTAEGPRIEGPTRKALLIYGFVLSLVLGVAAVVWLDSIDNRMRNAADVEELLGLPAIGLTPQLTGRDGVLPKLTHIYPLSAMAESYRILRTNILFALRDNPFKTLMVATGRPGQGGTTTICNLAIALAQIGKRIILIDADMRRPSLHKFFSVPNEAGLSTLLQGQGNLTDAFQKTDIENLIIVPAGPRPLNPSELLGSNEMRDLVRRLEEHCDLVLFDTPSTIVFSDGPMLASWIDAVLMVVSANQVPRGTEKQARELLERAKANVIGVVVNRMSPDNVDSCYYYAHYYSDSGVAPNGQDALWSGNGNGARGDDTAVVKGTPKAIPAPAAVASATPEGEAPPDAGEAEEDNPFPE